MIKLNLTTKNKEQELIKNYLENNVSETLAEKINNGVRIAKDGKTLISKKDLDGFMQFAKDEAKKQAEKGASYACIEDKIVYGWAIHYFEEDSIDGTLYNEDGSQYETPKPRVESKPVKAPEIKRPESPQIDMFEMMTTKPEPVATTPTSPIVEIDPNIDDIWGDDNYPKVLPSVTPKSIKQPEKPQDDYYAILNKILDNKLEAAL